MSSDSGPILLLSIAAAAVIWFVARNGPTKRLATVSAERDTMRQEKHLLHQQAIEKERNLSLRLADAAEEIEGLRSILAEKTKQFPWLATAIADLDFFVSERVSKRLATKKHPALKAAQEVLRISKEKREKDIALRIAKYKIEYYETLVPWISDLVDQDIDVGFAEEKLDEAANDEPAKMLLTDMEYNSLGLVEKFQLALDRYNKPGSKAPWIIGREYERFVGWEFEQSGYAVHYQGAIEGFEDLGRDLICRRGMETIIVQCKRWSVRKLIHEKHVLQLFGTTTEFRISSPKSEYDLFGAERAIKALLVTTTELSETARRMADALGVDVREQWHYKEWPQIKCNISSDGTKIFHLPFDQQYDRVKIDVKRGECYVRTVAEAVKQGFRRAYRWRGDQQD